MSGDGHTAEEMMAVAAARPAARRRHLLRRHRPAQPAANLARATHAPSCVLIYESGTIGAKPRHLPLSIGDGELAETADLVVSVPEIFSYWLQGGRIDVGFLGAAQIDRYANLNSTVIGEYEQPKVRLPGGGGAPEIAASCKETLVMLRHSSRAFVERLDFRTTVGYGDGPGARERLGLTGRGVSAVITDLGVLEPNPASCELVLRQVHRGSRWPTWCRHRLAAAGGRAGRGQPGADRGRAGRAAGAANGGAVVSRAVILSAVRTPIGRYGGALAGVRPDDLAAIAVRAAVDRAGVDRPRSRTSTWAAPTRPARTTATWRGWRCSWRGCRSRWRA